MSWEAIISLVVGIILTIIVERAYQRWRADAADYELWFGGSHVDLKDGPHADDRFKTGLTYVVDGAEVQHPFVTEFHVWSAGTKDIEPRMFHGNKSLVADLGAPIVKELPGGKAYDVDAADIQWRHDGTVTINPSLIKRGAVRTYRFLTDGRPSLTWTGSVANLDIFDLNEEWVTPTLDQRVAKIASFTMGVLIALVFISIIGFGFARPVVPPEVTAWLTSNLGYLMLAFVVGMPLSFLLSAYASTPARRPRRASRVRRTGLARADKTSEEKAEPMGRWAHFNR